MDFLRITETPTKEGMDVGVDYNVIRSKDLMVRGKEVYAIWNPETELWNPDIYDIPRMVDKKLWDHRDEMRSRYEGKISVKTMGNFSSNTWLKFLNYVGHLPDSYHLLDANLTFANTDTKKSDYVSRKLPYALAPGDCSAFLEILNTLYEPEEAEKILWMIGAIVSGDSKRIQKFIVLYGAPGTGKGTIIEIIQKLFDGYTSTFEAKTLTGSSAFATEGFRNNPLVAIDPDGDMSKIEDNTRLNSIVSHEPMTINEKFKASYTDRILAMLIVATNKPVRFTDAKSGLIRRMIDVRPSGALLSKKKYQALTSHIDFELGAIAYHCLEVYRSMGKDYYAAYQPIEMMLQTDVFFNFIEANYDVFYHQDGVTLTQAHEMYKEFCKESDLEFKMPRHKLRDELKNYFNNYDDRATVNDIRVRSWYSGFNADRFKTQTKKKDDKVFSLVMDEEDSLLDDLYMDQPAQYTTPNETPLKRWSEVTTTLSDIDTSKIHYVKPPKNHIVIDFDLKDADGNKSAERNLEAASLWPPTYGEFSKSGHGVHLHYIWDGDVSDLNRIYDDGIEVKVFTGDSSLRRRVIKCNSVPVATISTGLPLREKKKVISEQTVQSEKSLRALIERALRKEIHQQGTKPNVDFIKKILDDAYASKVSYNVEDLRPRLLAFANSSSNQALLSLKTVTQMKFKSDDQVSAAMGFEEPEMFVPERAEVEKVHDISTMGKDDRIVYFDVEVFPNLFMICYMYEDSDTVFTMINPSSQEMEQFLKLKLVGFNNRRYDNHMLYAALLGYPPLSIYKQSKKIIDKQPGAFFGEAYNLSYADIYDYLSLKKGLKKLQIELGLPHKELGFDWDKPVPEEKWPEVQDYCENDVRTTKAVAEAKAQDFVARQILADLSGLPVNSTTQAHTARIIFGNDRKPQEQFNYTDLSEMFPGYKYEFGKSTYKGVEVGEGGLVTSEPGIWYDVALLDVASMHPTSINELNLFGNYTPNFWDLVQARLAIKHKDYDKARTMLGGKLAPYLSDPEQAEALSYALKIVVNIVYGLTAATFDTLFKDPRNKDNIVAKRGALFMVDLKEFIESKGFKVVHTKTDSTKIANATPEIIAEVMAFGLKYGYIFEHEKTYSKMALVNDAVYVAKIGWSPKAKEIGTWTATGAQFKHPYVFKKLFSHEPIEFRDLCEEKHSQTDMYLDFEATSTMGLINPDQVDKLYKFVGRGGLFCPIKENAGGALLVKKKKTMKADADNPEGVQLVAVTGTKGYTWLEADYVDHFKKYDDIDMRYFDELVNTAADNIGKYGDFEGFID